MKTELKSTSNYELFMVHPHNRDISNTKVLEQSMRKYGFDPGLPIRCVKDPSGKLQITHGHHRFHVAKSIGLPVWYIVSSYDIPLFESEVSNHSWSIKDFATARARAGEKPALEVMKYHRETGIPLGCCISLVGGESAGSGNKKNQLKSGTLKASKNQHADDVADLVQFCKEVGFEFATTINFVKAISKCLRVKEFDKELFKVRVKTHPETMEPCRTLDQYIDMIEFVYNRMAKTKKIPLSFLVKETGLKAQATFGKM
jgi:hypothetical protein